jgi:hypothetical protein
MTCFFFCIQDGLKTVKILSQNNQSHTKNRTRDLKNNKYSEIEICLLAARTFFEEQIERYTAELC